MKATLAALFAAASLSAASYDIADILTASTAADTRAKDWKPGDGLALEVSGMDWTADGKLALSIRKGEVWGRPVDLDGTEPEASNTASPTMISERPSPDLTSTERSALSTPVPLKTVTLRALHRPPMPLTRPSTIRRLRACVTAKFTVGDDDSTPNSLP